MAKKSRRAKAKQRARAAKAAQERQQQQSIPTPATMPTPSKAQSPARMPPKAQASRAQDLASRYQYVLPEVKRIGIIAGSIIVVLIILSFILG
jgi:hypothetical protein